ncbi:MAG: aminoacyl-tRNA deacylase [Gammaproteobacteria bacterium]|nr:aminoacyl-tRNA deacylase [Gammaproteobacteria bacterium]
METEVTRILDKNGIKYTLKPHKNEALTCELAAQERGCRISQIVKTMIGKDSDGKLHVSLIPGNKILKLKKVRKEAGGIKIDLADPSEIARELNLIVGAISPLVFPKGTIFYIDPIVLEEEYVDISAGDPKIGIELLSKDLAKIVNGKICDIISSNS